MLQAAPLEEGEVEGRGLVVREGLVAEALDRIEVGVVAARDQRRAGVQGEGDVASQPQRAREIAAGRKVHGAA